MTSGFYGNDINLYLPIDKIYPNYTTAQNSASSDDIFFGRYILINYNFNENGDQSNGSNVYVKNVETDEENYGEFYHLDILRKSLKSDGTPYYATVGSLNLSKLADAGTNKINFNEDGLKPNKRSKKYLSEDYGNIRLKVKMTGTGSNATQESEFTINIPELGNAISDMWDVVYGKGEDEELRKTNLNRNDTPWSSNGFSKLYDLTTLGGCINACQRMFGSYNFYIAQDGSTAQDAINQAKKEKINTYFWDYNGFITKYDSNGNQVNSHNLAATKNGMMGAMYDMIKKSESDISSMITENNKKIDNKIDEVDDKIGEADSRIEQMDNILAGVGRGVNVGATSQIGQPTVQPEIFNHYGKNIATGIASHAEGYNTQATEQCAHAEGGDTIASGSHSHAEGGYTTALGAQSHAEGNSTTKASNYIYDNNGSLKTSEEILNTWTVDSEAEDGQKLFSLAYGQGSHIEGCDNLAMGNYSHAEGQYTKATGIRSHAEGGGSQAIGESSHAEGGGCKAGGSGSHAEGWISEAEGTGAHAEGYNTIAKGKGSLSGDGAHAEGSSTQAYGEGAHAEGVSTIASGVGSHAEGNSTAASGNYSHVEGFNGITGDDAEAAHAEGYQTQALGFGAHAEGALAHAWGSYSHAEGYNTQATESCAHAEGGDTIASGSHSHAEGQSTQATKVGSHAEGGDTIAEGEYSHAEGRETNAKGNYSHAEGYSTKAIKVGSHAEGYLTQATESCAHAEGGDTIASGSHSHAEGYMTKATGAYSHAEGWGNFKDASGGIPGVLEIAAAITAATQEVTKNEFQTWQQLLSAFKEETDPVQKTIYAGYVAGVIITVKQKYPDEPTIAEGAASHAEGFQTRAIGNYSHAEGNKTIALYDSSHIEGGSSSLVTGVMSVDELLELSNGDIIELYKAAGKNFSLSRGNYSHVEGHNNLGLGETSHAEGYNTIARGNYSHAGGYNTIAYNYQTVVGRYNQDNSDKAPTLNLDYNDDSWLFIVGNGLNDGYKTNAFTVSANGTTSATTSAATNADFAEYFEWKDGNILEEDRRGLFVTLEGDKIRFANKNDDYVLGAISSTGAFIGNTAGSFWHDRYMKDIFGKILTEEVEIPEKTIVEKQKVIDEETGEFIYKDIIIEKIPAHVENWPIVNPQYDPNQTYLFRSERPEWDVVGLCGQVIVVDDGTCEVNGYCYPGQNGVGTKSDKGYRVMKRLDDTHIKVLIK